ncbi:DUF2500 domain-containing protein [Leptolyngbya sp. FACHB-541]|uniref:DUF2500 domain-containing protein n=1 Tax=Leptolyngbya sp. FACHB-541 TaxID=2692810 RepID=UPI0016882739|nr:DUF2500 domain-containing protein [Leptolyngbya sp. FACHB-541]MBD1997789.1 DUF2500 domain-containing protein [Leptolyngbya sp. FACHB-541]
MDTLLVVGFFVLAAVSIFLEIRKQLKLQQQPVLSSPARVAAKYSSAREFGDARGGYSSAPRYVVFELKSGETITLKVGSLYDAIAEGEKGILTYQGDQCLNFQW